MIKNTTITISLFLLFSSCENVFLEEELATTNPKINFDYLWQKCLEEYSYFNVKNIDWQAVKDKYEPALNNEMSQDSLFTVLSEMLNELKDGHVNLFSDFRTSFYTSSLQEQDNFDWRIVVDNYLISNYEITGGFQHSEINNNLGYIRLSSFTEKITSKQLDYLLQKYSTTNGMILDLRENGGGKIENVYRILERFINKSTTIYYSKIKSGIGTDDFSFPKPVIINPYQGIKYLKPLVVLVDSGTFSSASLVALATNALPHIKLIGQKTSGGLGMPRGGQLPNGWYYRFSVTQTLDLNKSPNQENGVIPDIEVLMNWQDRTKDEVLEKAIKQLKE